MRTISPMFLHSKLPKAASRKDITWSCVHITDRGSLDLFLTLAIGLFGISSIEIRKFMRTEQKRDWDFQEYVVPHHRPQDSAYRPLTVSQMTSLLGEVKATVGLPDDLRVGDLRKTAIVQMIESGVDHLAIQSVSGHKSVSSLNPYNKFSLKTAQSALERRQRQ